MNLQTHTTHRQLWIIGLIGMVLINGALWLSVRDVKSRWTNVPPVPSRISAAFSGLGDEQFAYRTIGLSVQNLGDTGGRVTNLAEYNYETLGKWMMLEHSFDPVSNFMPTLAGFLFGASNKSTDLKPIIDYMEIAGSVKAPQKWRWLAQAAFLAKHKMKDMNRALELANKLAAMDDPDMPIWTKQMPGFILNQQGEKQAALALMIQLLKTEGEKLNPTEINAIKGYICEQIFEPEEAKTHALCQDL